MSVEPKIFNEALSQGDERVAFLFQHNDSEPCGGFISCSALLQLDKMRGDDLLTIFERNRNEIAAAALRHWRANGANMFIVLGTGDF